MSRSKRRRRLKTLRRIAAAAARLPRVRLRRSSYSADIVKRAALIPFPNDSLPQVLVDASSIDQALTVARKLITDRGLHLRKKVKAWQRMKLWGEWASRPTRLPLTNAILLPTEWYKRPARARVRTLMHELGHVLQEVENKDYARSYLGSSRRVDDPTNAYIALYLDEMFRWMYEVQNFGVEVRIMVQVKALGYSDHDVANRINRIAEALKDNYRLSAHQDYIERLTRDALMAHVKAARGD